MGKTIQLFSNCQYLTIANAEELSVKEIQIAGTKHILFLSENYMRKLIYLSVNYEAGAGS